MRRLAGRRRAKDVELFIRLPGRYISESYSDRSILSPSKRREVAPDLAVPSSELRLV
jgi:hypothetical protein